MTARDDILAAIGAAAVPPSPAAPALSAVAVASDPVVQFVGVLAEVGGHGVVCSATQSIDDAIAGICSSLGIASADLLVLNGRFAVTENAAVYVDSDDIDERASIVRAEHVALIISQSSLVPTMHEAMRMIPKGSRCGWFLSGPSKTADIEQSLVIGAQGARTLHVVIRND